MAPSHEAQRHKIRSHSKPIAQTSGDPPSKAEKAYISPTKVMEADGGVDVVAELR
eukprot:CAMPEP_0115653262 /NCGR_PEP_ID=MMETSP0272-20121206/42502_1 /TAXON_ID=71861 /ORGANISM="Scrippsiella trochoidea, Strain CCMP3099" /LENGTH=54 /DNA_ID=CAMNT_0003091109 /DNA_START=133 /DNA_END=293 /DNA_ORIENTATION=-